MKRSHIELSYREMKFPECFTLSLLKLDELRTCAGLLWVSWIFFSLGN